MTSVRQLTISKLTTAHTNESFRLALGVDDLLSSLCTHVPRAKKDGDSWSPIVWKDGRRAKDNALFVSCLVYDLDWDERADRVEALAHLENCLRLLDWQYVLHETYTASRYRLCIPLLRDLRPEEYPVVWEASRAKLNIEVDPSGKDLGRLFYAPSHPPGETRSSKRGGHQLYSPAVPALLPAAAPVERPPAWTGPATTLSADGQSLLATLKALPLFSWAMERPDEVSREAWRGLGQAIAALLEEKEGTAPDAEMLKACEALFHEVSAADTTRYRQNATARAFADARKSVLKLGGPLSYRHMADHGAPAATIPADGTSNPAVHARHRHRLQQAREYHASREVSDFKEPLQLEAANTPAAPAAAPAAAPQALAVVPPAPPAPPSGINVKGWAPQDCDRYFFDASLELFRYKKRGEETLSAGMAKSSMAQLLCADFGISAKAALRLMETFHILEEDVLDPSLSTGVALRPPQPGNTETRFVYNAYRDSPLKPVAGNWDNIRNLMLILAGGELPAYEYFMDWTASPVYSLRVLRLAQKLRTAVVLAGPKGAGKGTFEHILNLIYGEAFVVPAGQELLDSQYQGILINKLFVVADECHAHDRASTERLKRLVTSPRLDIEEKFRARAVYPNRANYLFTTNRMENPVRVDEDDRRFSIFFTLPKDQAVLDAVWADLNGPQTELAAFLHFLLTRKITHNLERPCETAARKSVQTAMLSPAEAFAKDVLEHGLLDAAAPWLQGSGLRQLATGDGKTDVSCTTLFAVYRSWAHANGFRNAGGADRGISNRFIKAGLVTKSVTKRVAGNLVRVYEGIPFEPQGAPPEEEAAAPETESEDTPTDEHDFGGTSK